MSLVDAANPVTALSDLTQSLPSASAEEFPRAWMLRALASERARYSMEDDYVDPTSQELVAVRAAWMELIQADNWIHPVLQKFLMACRSVAEAPELPRKEGTRKIANNGHSFTVVENEAYEGIPLSVSSAYALAVAIIERSLGDPEHSARMVAAFADKVAILKARHGVDHLVFIEKEAGPVGAVTMLSSLVNQTGLPACVYRETHWAERAALSGKVPLAGSRLAFVYDLIVTGSALRHAAERIRSLVGAESVAAVVLCGYQERRDSLETTDGQVIHLEALMWDSRQIELPSSAPGEVGEGGNSSSSREASRGDEMRQSQEAPTGTFTRDNLPPLSEEASRILERVYAKSGRPTQLVARPERQKRSQPGSRLTLTDNDPRGLRITDNELAGKRLVR